MSDKSVDYSWEAWAEAFLIFAKYEPHKFGNISAEYDVIYAGPDPEKVSDEDKARLEQLGWSVEDEYSCFYQFT